MLTIYTPVQRTHRHAYILKQSTLAHSFETPERVDSILSAIREANLGPVIAPDDAGLDPIHAVHDAGMVSFLAAASAEHRTDKEPISPLFPMFFPPPGQLLIYRPAQGKFFKACRSVMDPPTIKLVSYRDFQIVQACQDVQLGNSEAVKAV